MPPVPFLSDEIHKQKVCDKVVIPRVALSSELKLSRGIVLAPMAGVTTYPYRYICRHYGADLTVSEMIHSSMLESNQTIQKAIFSASTQADEIPSAQLYGTDPTCLANATTFLRKRGVRHIDLNFGCPAPKVIRAGGGAAIPSNTSLLYSIAKEVVNAADDVPVTAKMRLGVHGKQTYLHAAEILQKAGIAGITLHTRTAEEHYEKNAARNAWNHIRKLKEILDIPVFGNGDIFTAQDAVDMLQLTNADGVAIGRGCLGRPWLFRDIQNAIAGNQCETTIPPWCDVARTMLWHLNALLLVLDAQSGSLTNGRHKKSNSIVILRQFRKWIKWYTQGYHLPSSWIAEMQTTQDIEQASDSIIKSSEWDVSVDENMIIAERGKTRPAVR